MDKPEIATLREQANDLSIQWNFPASDVRLLLDEIARLTQKCDELAYALKLLTETYEAARAERDALKEQLAIANGEFAPERVRREVEIEKISWQITEQQVRAENAEKRIQTLESALREYADEIEVRVARFNDAVGALGYVSSYGLTGANHHPDRCKCQGSETTPHKHYSQPPHSCARCHPCEAYRPAVPLGPLLAQKALKD